MLQESKERPDPEELDKPWWLFGWGRIAIGNGSCWIGKYHEYIAIYEDPDVYEATVPTGAMFNQEEIELIGKILHELNISKYAKPSTEIERKHIPYVEMCGFYNETSRRVVIDGKTIIEVKDFTDDLDPKAKGKIVRDLHINGEPTQIEWPRPKGELFKNCERLLVKGEWSSYVRKSSKKLVSGI